MDNRRALQVLTLLLSALVVVGCASSRSGQVYSRHEARQQMAVEFGVVEHVRKVLIEGTEGTIGTAAGAIVGGIAGSGVGGGRGSAIASVLGAVAGGMIGANMEENVTKRDALEITVRLESGAIRAFVQEATPDDNFVIGDRVRIVRRGGVARVSR